MHLKLKELQQVVKRTMRDEKSHIALREELTRVLGQGIEGKGDYISVAKAANEQLDILESTGRFPRQGSFKLSVLVEAITSQSSAVRKLAARVLPEKFIRNMINDSESSVRTAAAKRLSYAQIREAIRKYPGDDQLRYIAKAKRLAEAGLPTPKAEDEPFDMYGDKPMGDSGKTQEGDDMSDAWYERKAIDICKQFGSNIEGQWEEIIATRVVASHYSTMRVMLDREKLLKAIYDNIKTNEDAVLGEGSLKSLIHRLRSDSHLDESFMPVIEESNDPIKSLLESNLSPSDYVKKAEEVFTIRKSTVPAGIKKFRIGENRLIDTMIPVKGQMPDGKCINSIAERALETYVKHWNGQQSLRGEPYTLTWNHNPMGMDIVGFNVTLK